MGRKKQKETDSRDNNGESEQDNSEVNEGSESTDHEFPCGDEAIAEEIPQELGNTTRQEPLRRYPLCDRKPRNFSDYVT